MFDKDGAPLSTPGIELAIDLEIALPFSLGALDTGLGLSQAIHTRLQRGDFSASTFAPVGSPAGSLRSLSQGMVGFAALQDPQGPWQTTLPREWLANRLMTLPSATRGLVVVEDELSRPAHSGIQGDENWFSVDEAVYWFCGCAGPAPLIRLIESVESARWVAGVLTERVEELKPHVSYGIEVLDQMVGDATAFFHSAYDTDSYILWTRQSAAG